MQIFVATPILGAVLCKNWIINFVSHSIGQIILLTYILYYYPLGIGIFICNLFLGDTTFTVVVAVFMIFAFGIIFYGIENACRTAVWYYVRAKEVLYIYS